MKIDEIPTELEEALTNAVNALIEKDDQISHVCVHSKATGWAAEPFEYSLPAEQDEDGELRIEGTATFRGDHDEDKPFGANQITAHVELVARRNEESGAWEVEVREVSNVEHNGY